MSTSQFYWGSSAVWDADLAHFACVSSPVGAGQPYHLLTYDALADSWAWEDTGIVPFAGHAYDANALDPESGRHFFNFWTGVGGGPYYRDRGDAATAWTAMPGCPTTGNVVAQVWVPELLGGTGALLHLWTNGTMSYWTEDGGWVEVSGAAGRNWGAPGSIYAEYNPHLGKSIIGAGANVFLLDSDLSTSQLSAPPSSASVAAGAFIAEPSAPTFLFVDIESGTERMWRYDAEADSYTQIFPVNTQPNQLGTPGFPFPGDYAPMWAPIPELGVVGCVMHYSADRHFCLYRPPA